MQSCTILFLPHAVFRCSGRVPYTRERIALCRGVATVPHSLPYTPHLLQLASEGQPLPLDGPNLMLVKALLQSGYIRADVVPDENAIELLCHLTPLGEEFYNWLYE